MRALFVMHSDNEMSEAEIEDEGNPFTDDQLMQIFDNEMSVVVFRNGHFESPSILEEEGEEEDDEPTLTFDGWSRV